MEIVRKNSDLIIDEHIKIFDYSKVDYISLTIEKYKIIRWLLLLSVTYYVHKLGTNKPFYISEIIGKYFN